MSGASQRRPVFLARSMPRTAMRLGATIVMVTTIGTAQNAGADASPSSQLAAYTTTATKMDPDKAVVILDLDIFKYFNLTDDGVPRYDTPLQRQTYQRTAKGTAQLRELQKVRSALLKKRLYTTPQLDIGPYDLKKGGFIISLSTNPGGSKWRTADGRVAPPVSPRECVIVPGGSTATYCFPTLPIRERWATRDDEADWHRLLFLSATKAQALRIEKGGVLHLFFTPTGTKRYRVSAGTESYVIGRSVTLVVADSSGQVVLVRKFR